MGSSLSCEYGKPGLEDISDIQDVYFSQYRLALCACATATTAFYAMRAVFINFKISILTDGSLYKLGLVKRDWTILIVATIILFISSVMKEKGMSLRDFVAERPLVVRWVVYLILIFATAPFGYVSSSTEFMYAQF